MNNNSFLKMLGLQYIDLSEVFPDFHYHDPEVTYYRKGELTHFERELFLASNELHDRISGLTDGANSQDNSSEDQALIIDDDHFEAVEYMKQRATANFVPIEEELACLESHHQLCWEFFEKKVRERLSIPWSQGFIITEGFNVDWFFFEIIVVNQKENNNEELHEDDEEYEEYDD